METRDEILDALADKRDEIRAFGVTELGVFGSFARNEARANSDVDVPNAKPSKITWACLIFWKVFSEGKSTW